MTFEIAPPTAEEHAPFYARYVALATAAGDARALLARQTSRLRARIEPLSDEAALARYAPGKWSVKEILGHVADAERIFGYRLLRVARGDQTPLPGFDENAYARAAGSDARALAALLDDFDAARRSTLSLLQSLEPEALSRVGRANDHPVTARALVYITAGHLEHHLQVLGERYGV